MTRPDQTRPDQTATHAQNSHHRKILLLTLYGNGNYGNILQRCALSQVVEALGFEVWHLCGVHIPDPQHPAKKFIKQIIKHILAFLGVKKFRRQFQSQALTRKIEPLFAKFQDKYITKRIYMTRYQALAESPSRWNEYDYAITGSDQVWHNWSHTAEELAYYYLLFMSQEKRVCYAPSFGFSEFFPEDYWLHKLGLAGFERLSCREEEMIELIRQASGKTPQLVLDPTLLLSADDWRKYESKPAYDVPDKYVLCYFLGNKTPEYTQAISQAAGGLPIISILDIDDKSHILADPGAFLWLIDHADFVCTDSFHGTAFSVNFGKEFMSFKRRQKGAEGMFGRIDSLLTNLGISGHIFGEGVSVRPEAVNYDDVYVQLSSMRKSSMRYLKECLKVQE